MTGRVKLSTRTAMSPHAWCACGRFAFGPHALSEMKTHLRESPECKRVFALAVMTIIRVEPAAQPSIVLPAVHREP